MAQLRVTNFSISLDGYAAGPDQGPEAPLGVGGDRLHEWFLPTRTFRRMIGEEGGTEDVDDQYAVKADVGVGATIMGRNMFGHLDGGPVGYECTEMVGTSGAVHLRLTRSTG